MENTENLEIQLNKPVKFIEIKAGVFELGKKISWFHNLIMCNAFYHRYNKANQFLIYKDNITIYTPNILTEYKYYSIPLVCKRWHLTRKQLKTLLKKYNVKLRSYKQDLTKIQLDKKGYMFKWEVNKKDYSFKHFIIVKKKERKKL